MLLIVSLAFLLVPMLALWFSCGFICFSYSFLKCSCAYFFRKRFSSSYGFIKGFWFLCFYGFSLVRFLFLMIFFVGFPIAFHMAIAEDTSSTRWPGPPGRLLFSFLLRLSYGHCQGHFGLDPLWFHFIPGVAGFNSRPFA